MTLNTRHWLPHISLREFLGIVSFVAIGAAALRFASPAWAGAAISITLLLGLAMAIAAFIDRGGRQAFAVGFAVSAVGYWTIMWLMPSPPMLAPYASSVVRYHQSGVDLPTTQALQWMYDHISVTYTVDPTTGEVIAPYNRTPTNNIPTPAPVYAAPPTIASPGPPVTFPTPTVSGAAPTYVETRPSATHFFSVGHCLWTLLIAYAGGKFAAMLYQRRELGGASPPANGTDN